MEIVNLHVKQNTLLGAAQGMITEQQIYTELETSALTFPTAEILPYKQLRAGQLWPDFESIDIMYLEAKLTLKTQTSQKLFSVDAQPLALHH